MISKVSLKNFKLHTSTDIEVAPITVFIGPNNSGKSSIFQALLSLRQAASVPWQNLYHVDRRLHPELLIIDIGEFDDVVRQGSKEIRISVEGKVLVPSPEQYGPEVGISFTVWVRDNRLVYHSGSLSIPIPNQGTASWITGSFLEGAFPGGEWKWKWEWRGSPPSTRPSITLQNVPTEQNLVLYFEVAPHFGLIDTGGTGPRDGVSPERLLEATGFQEFLAFAPRRLLASLHPIFPLRGMEEWGYPLPDSTPDNLEQLTLRDRALALTSALVYKDDEAERLSEWLEDLLHLSLKVKFLPGKRVTIRSKQSGESNTDKLFLNEGTGASQLPFILLPIGLTPPNETILLSEPEVHLHPKLQSALMRLLLQIAKRENKQFLIETHSEHVLHSLLYAVARGDLKKDELAIYYFENVEGEARVRPLPVNEMGQVEGGLPGFFDQALTELTEYLDAMANKK